MTWQGTVVSINIATASKEPMQSVERIEAVAGKGLRGDRNFGEAGSMQLTLIESEAIASMEREIGLKLADSDARRNIVTKGVSLNDLVDQEFTVGGVKIRGLKLSEPCQHLADLTDPKVLKGLVHKGGLKAEILTDGEIAVGNVVTGA